MTSEPLRLLVVDDHPLVRNGLRALLASVPDMAVVGEATSGEEAITQAVELQPDIILMDLHMPGLNGVEATRRIVQTHPHIGVLVLTMLEDDASVFAAMRAGARGYLLKGADQTDVLRAIGAVAHGEAIFSPAIAHRLMQYFANMQPILPQAAFPDLTEREREILGLIAPRPSCARERLAWGRDRMRSLLHSPKSPFTAEAPGTTVFRVEWQPPEAAKSKQKAKRRNVRRNPRMSTYHYRYPVSLSEQQRRWLEAMVHTSTTPAKHYLVARVLLMSDQSQGGPSHTDGQIAEALEINRRTVIRIKKRFVQENLEVALTGSFPRERPERRCLDGKGEAHPIQLACSKAPEGHQRWTVRLLADRMVQLEYVEHISPEAVRTTPKKTS